MRTQKNITKHELIGLRAQIVNARNPANVGIIGKIVDETTHTIVLEQAGKERRVFKKCVELELNVDGETIKVDGALLEGRPWDRIKKKNGN
jgi:ribonuclease P protein subunit POP4